MTFQNALAECGIAYSCFLWSLISVKIYWKYKSETISCLCMGILLLFLPGVSFLICRFSFPVFFVKFVLFLFFFLIFYRMVRIAFSKKIFIYTAFTACAAYTEWIAAASGRFFLAHAALSAAFVTFCKYCLQDVSAFLLRDTQNRNIWMFLWSAPAAAGINVFRRSQREFDAVSFFDTTIPFLLLGLIVYLLYLSAKTSDQLSEIASDNRLLRLQMEQYRNLYEELEKTRRFLHDFRQHYAVFSELRKTGNMETAKDYLAEIPQEKMGNLLLICRNMPVNALLQFYVSEGNRIRAVFDWKIDLPEHISIPERDLCVLMGNLLENALHACALLPSEQRIIKCHTNCEHDPMILLLVENPYTESRPSIHTGEGIGLESVRKIVARYQGTMKVLREGGVFTVKILLQGKS
ncbi:MAG: sensor histidine kinase [Clostridia bacterium]